VILLSDWTDLSPDALFARLKTIPGHDNYYRRTVGDFVRDLIRGGVATAVHDLSDGGLAVALAEMAMASGIGATIETPDSAPIAAFFGEDQGRYLVTISAANAALLRDIQLRADEGGFRAEEIGETGGRSLKLGKARAIPVADLTAAHESWFPAFMAA